MTLVPPWHTDGLDAVVRALDADVERGLTDAQAAERRSRFGVNELARGHRASPLSLFVAQFKNVLIGMLLVAVVLSLTLGHGTEAAVIAIIVLLSALLGFVQEYRAERSFEALNALAAPMARVIRSGEERAIPARDLVPGDVVLLQAGDKVPADGRLLEAVNLQLDEAALTGESLPADKQVSPPVLPPDAPTGDRANMVHGGSIVTLGRGRALVVATGMTTEFGRIALLLQTVKPVKTPFQEKLDRLASGLAKASLAVVLVIVVLGLLRGQPLFEMFLFGVALAVAAVPEALPAVVTMSLAIGVQRMFRRNVLIRRLPAVETLGSVSVICSDKTGTLTKGEMTARTLHVADTTLTVSGSGYEPQGDILMNGVSTPQTEALTTLLRAAALASDATLVQREGRWEINGDPTEGALVVLAAKAGLHKAALEREFRRVHEAPFTAETKRMTTWHDTGAGLVAYTKGAPEVIIPACTMSLTATGPAALTPAGSAQLLDVALGMAQDALRIMAVAYKSTAAPDDTAGGFTFLGLIGMMDPPRLEAKAAIQQCIAAGIRPVMITGDHAMTAQAVARELGLPCSDAVLDGPALDAMSDAQLAGQASSVGVYARVTPAHKLRIVTALQANGHYVAMTGDGVNDAPALKKADIGIAMGITGTDVSKEAAAMTLLDDNFTSIVTAVEEGRAIFANIKKYLMFLLSSNVGEIVLVAAAVLAGLPLPLGALQILYVNLLTDGLPALALAADPSEPGLMQRPPRNPKSGIFTRPVLGLLLTGGLWSAACNLALFVWELNATGSTEKAMALVFISLILIQFFKAYAYRSDRQSMFLRPFANRWLNLAILSELVLLGGVIYLPPLQDAFGTFPFALEDWAAVLATAFTVIPVLEACKWVIRRGWFGPLEQVSMGLAPITK